MRALLPHIGNEGPLTTHDVSGLKRWTSTSYKKLIDYLPEMGREEAMISKMDADIYMT